MPRSFENAITRVPAQTFDRGLTTSKLGPPDYASVLKQHHAYTDALASIGLNVIELEPLPHYPDAHFVEDTAVVTPEMAIITNPGAASRQGEEKTIAAELEAYRQIESIQAPGTLDGGDVLMIDNHFLIGLSERTNQQGADQFGRILDKHNKTHTTVAVGAGLHFKSSVNFVGKNTLIVTPDFAEHQALKAYDKIVANPDECYAANTLWVNDHLLVPKGFPNTKAKLEALGLPIIELDVSEIQKMDGGLTCLSIRF
ncbi:MAG: arginine deiminase family protein [Desulfobacterales bacterium]|nr:arginine deiminase family protein [Desulfobacterales bacterium]